MALLVVLFAISALAVHFGRDVKVAAKTTASSPNAEPPQPKTYTESVDSAFTVPRLHYKASRFVIPSDAKDAFVQGHFTASGGAHNDIEVWIMNADGFVNWQNGHPPTPLYNSGKVTQGTISLSLPETGTYVIVFNNQFSVISPKAVEDNVTVAYKR
jgi:hypothetical protein